MTQDDYNHEGDDNLKVCMSQSSLNCLIDWAWPLLQPLAVDFSGSVVLSSRQSSIVLSERPGPGSQALSVALSETRGPGSQALSVAVSEAGFCLAPWNP